MTVTMYGLCCSLLFLLLVVLSLLGLSAAVRGGLSHSSQSSSHGSANHGRLFSQPVQCHTSQRNCGADSMHSLLSSLASTSSSRAPISKPLDTPLPRNITFDSIWMPGQASGLFVQLGYWYVAWGEGVNNYQAYTILKVDGSSHQPVNNVTLNSTYQILGVFGNSSHIFVQVYTGDWQALVVMTFQADTLQLVGEVTVRVGPQLLWGVNAAGTLLIVAKPSYHNATIVSASTGKPITTLNGGRTNLSLDAAAYDVSTDAVIVADSSHNGSVYGIALNNTLLWTIPLPGDQVGVLDLAVDRHGRSLYVLMTLNAAKQLSYNLRFVQYDLTTLSEVGRYNIVNRSVVPVRPFAAGPVVGEVYAANGMDGTVVRVSMTSGVVQSTSLSRYPFVSQTSAVASLNGESFIAYTTAPFELLTISSAGIVLRRSLIAPMDACGVFWSGPNNIDIDMHGNIVVPLCSLGVRVYSPNHTLLHVIHTPNNTQPTGVAVTPSGQYVYVSYSDSPIPWPMTQLYEVETGKFVSNFSSFVHNGPTAIAVDSADNSLWAVTFGLIYHWAMNNTLLSTFQWPTFTGQLVVDSQHRRLVTSVNALDGYTRLEWHSMADGSLVQQFQSASDVRGGAAVAVAKDSALTVAVSFNSVWYFFRNDTASNTTAEEPTRQRPEALPVEAG